MSKINRVTKRSGKDLNDYEKRRIRSILDCDEGKVIEHVGSTAIPNLDAKPIIDIMLGIKSLEEGDRQLDRLVSIGYETDAPI